MNSISFLFFLWFCGCAQACILCVGSVRKMPFSSPALLSPSSARPSTYAKLQDGVALRRLALRTAVAETEIWMWTALSPKEIKTLLYFEDKVKQIMLNWIRWYRETLSPVMPPNCRFFPSCSNYAIQAIEEFGALKGGVLTAWRLLRCSPVGGYGFDPPEWPPCSYFRKNYNPPLK